eukprot:TRINITY_DN59488_c0_g1_i1.p1 TRINITY_DN59488_c0_g1~~TRINITY_DN59488_c0_g1_i1.p1  ORF type:complete len:269 (+),score=34.84 TRINITY_DN59488_c0_g1_i1:81-887(+)
MTLRSALCLRALRNRVGEEVIELSSQPRLIGAELHRRLCQRPPESLALEAIGRTAVLRALKAVATASSTKRPLRFVPVAFECDADLPDDALTGRGRRGRSRATRGIRFFLAPWSVGPRTVSDGCVEGQEPPPLRVSAQTDVGALAQALITERRYRDRSSPVILEAVCTAWHSLVICQALAVAQQLAFRSRDHTRRFTCSTRVSSSSLTLSTPSPATAPMLPRRTQATIPIDDAIVENAGTDDCHVVSQKSPRFVQVLVWSQEQECSWE